MPIFHTAQPPTHLNMFLKQRDMLQAYVHQVGRRVPALATSWDLRGGPEATSLKSGPTSTDSAVSGLGEGNFHALQVVPRAAGLDPWLILFSFLVPVDLKACLHLISFAFWTKHYSFIHPFILACSSRFLSRLALPCERCKIRNLRPAGPPAHLLSQAGYLLCAIGSTSTPGQTRCPCPNGPFTLPYLCCSFLYYCPNKLPEIWF